MLLSKFKKFQVLTWSLAALFLSASLYGAPPKPPKLETVEQRIAFLLWAKEHVPTLFQNAVSYDRDWLELLASQDRIQKQLEGNATYRSMNASRPDPIRIEIFKPGQEIKMDPATIQALKNQINRITEHLPDNNINAYVSEKIGSQAKVLFRADPQSLATGLIQALPNELKSQAFKASTFEQRLAILQAHLPDMLPAAFRGKDFGFGAEVTKAEALALLKDSNAAKEELSDLLVLKAALGGKSGDLPNAKGAVLQATSKLDVHSAPYLTDREVFKSAVSRELKKITVSDQQKSDQIEKRLIGAQDRAMDLAKVFLPAGDQAPVQRQPLMSIQEVPSFVGIFRGCTGNDCSTLYSFPYPNSPKERVFFVYDKAGALKGYVATTYVKEGGRDALYIHTIAGPNLSTQDADFVLHSLNQKARDLGVTEVLIPPGTKVHSNVNFQVIRQAYASAAARSPGQVSISYPDAEIRNILDASVSMTYDRANTNTVAHRFVPDAAVNSSIVAEARPHSFPEISTNQLSPEARKEAFYWAISLFQNGKGTKAAQIMAAMKDNRNLQAVNNILINPNRRTRAQFLSEVGAALDLPDLATNPRAQKAIAPIMQNGLLLCPDPYDRNSPQAFKQIIQLVEVKDTTPAGTRQLVSKFFSDHFNEMKDLKPSADDVLKLKEMVKWYGNSELNFKFDTLVLDRPDVTLGDFHKLLKCCDAGFQNFPDEYTKHVKKYLPKIRELAKSPKDLLALSENNPIFTPKLTSEIQREVILMSSMDDIFSAGNSTNYHLQADWVKDRAKKIHDPKDWLKFVDDVSKKLSSPKNMEQLHAIRLDQLMDEKKATFKLSPEETERLARYKERVVPTRAELVARIYSMSQGGHAKAMKDEWHAWTNGDIEHFINTLNNSKKHSKKDFLKEAAHELGVSELTEEEALKGPFASTLETGLMKAGDWLNFKNLKDKARFFELIESHPMNTSSELKEAKKQLIWNACHPSMQQDVFSIDEILRIKRSETVQQNPELDSLINHVALLTRPTVKISDFGKLLKCCGNPSKIDKKAYETEFKKYLTKAKTLTKDPADIAALAIDNPYLSEPLKKHLQLETMSVASPKEAIRLSQGSAAVQRDWITHVMSEKAKDPEAQVKFAEEVSQELNQVRDPNHLYSLRADELLQQHRSKEAMTPEQVQRFDAAAKATALNEHELKTKIFQAKTKDEVRQYRSYAEFRGKNGPLSVPTAQKMTEITCKQAVSLLKDPKFWAYAGGATLAGSGAFIAYEEHKASVERDEAIQRSIAADKARVEAEMVAKVKEYDSKVFGSSPAKDGSSDGFFDLLQNGKISEQDAVAKIEKAIKQFRNQDLDAKVIARYKTATQSPLVLKALSDLEAEHVHTLNDVYNAYLAGWVSSDQNTSKMFRDGFLSKMPLIAQLKPSSDEIYTLKGNTHDVGINLALTQVAADNAKNAKEFSVAFQSGIYNPTQEYQDMLQQSLTKNLPKLAQLNPTPDDINALKNQIGDIKSIINIVEQSISKAKTVDEYMSYYQPAVQSPTDAYLAALGDSFKANLDQFKKLNPTVDDIQKYKRSVFSIGEGIALSELEATQAKTSADFVKAYTSQTDSPSEAYSVALGNAFIKAMPTLDGFNPSVSDLIAFKQTVPTYSAAVALSDSAAKKANTAAEFIGSFQPGMSYTTPQYLSDLQKAEVKDLTLLPKLHPTVDELNQVKSQLNSIDDIVHAVELVSPRAKTAAEFVSYYQPGLDSPSSAYLTALNGSLKSHIKDFAQLHPTVDDLNKVKVQLDSIPDMVRAIEVVSPQAKTAAELLSYYQPGVDSPNNDYLKALSDSLKSHMKDFAKLHPTDGDLQSLGSMANGAELVAAYQSLSQKK